MGAGDARAFDEFFHSHAPRLVAYISRRSGLDAASVEDIVQNTMVKAMRNLRTYRGEAALFTWLTQIGRHELADAMRKSARRPLHVSIQDPDQSARLATELKLSPHYEPAAQAEAEMAGAAVLHALNSLPERYSIALEAKYGDGLSVEEIAVMLGVTTTAAQSLLARAREAFRDRWRASNSKPGEGATQDE